MKKLLFIIILIVQPYLCLGQQKISFAEQLSTSGAIHLVFAKNVEKARELADLDIRRESPFLFIQSGIAPTVYKTDSIFERDYEVNYYEQGCVGPGDEFMKAYNFIILDQMRTKYGLKWKRKIRKDVVGYKEWKKQN